MLILDLSPPVRAHLAVAIRSHARQLRRDGGSAPPELDQLAAALLGQQPPARDDLSLLDIGAVAGRLGVSPSTVKRLIASGELASVLVRRRRLVRASDVDRFTMGQQSSGLAGPLGTGQAAG